MTNRIRFVSYKNNQILDIVERNIDNNKDLYFNEFKKSPLNKNADSFKIVEL